MNKGSSLLRWSGLLTAVAAVLIFGTHGLAALTGKDLAQRPDVIKIGVMQKFGDLERPVVTFFHDKHTAAVQEMGKDCTACHQQNVAVNGFIGYLEPCVHQQVAAIAANQFPAGMVALAGKLDFKLYTGRIGPAGFGGNIRGQKNGHANQQ